MQVNEFGGFKMVQEENIHLVISSEMNEKLRLVLRERGFANRQDFIRALIRAAVGCPAVEVVSNGQN